MVLPVRPESGQIFFITHIRARECLYVSNATIIQAVRRTNVRRKIQHIQLLNLTILEPGPPLGGLCSLGKS